MNFVTMDIETTGLDIYKDEPIQMAYTVHNPADQLLHQDSFYLNVNRELPAIITKITGTTQAVLQSQGISPSEGVKEWQAVLKMYQPVTLIGYNILNFDFPMVQNWVNAHSSQRFKFPSVCQIIDVMIILAAQRNSKWLKLAEAGRVCNIIFELDDLHDALADVKLTWEVYKTLR